MLQVEKEKGDKLLCPKSRVRHHAYIAAGWFIPLGLSIYRPNRTLLYRSWLNQKGVLTSEQLKRCKDGQKVRIAGMAVVLQRPPTAKGHAFLTLEDEFLSFMDIIIRPQVYDAHRRIVRKLLLVVEGSVQRHGNVLNVLAERIYGLQNAVSK